MIWHYAPCKEAISLCIPEAHRIGRDTTDLWITQKTRTHSAIKIFSDFLWAILRDQGLLAGQQICAGPFCNLQQPMTLDDPIENLPGQRVGQMERDEVEPRFLFPVRQTATAADSYFSENGLRRSLRVIGGSVWSFERDSTRAGSGAGADARTTAGLETGATVSGRGSCPTASPWSAQLR